MEIHSKSPEELREVHQLQINNAGLNFKEASDRSREKAREICKDAMMLAWCNGKTGDFFPNYDCGRTDKPPWRVFADARGGNLTIDINDGEYIFIYLKV